MHRGRGCAPQVLGTFNTFHHDGFPRSRVGCLREINSPGKKRQFAKVNGSNHINHTRGALKSPSKFSRILDFFNF